jgi:hypothetical protein
MNKIMEIEMLVKEKNGEVIGRSCIDLDYVGRGSDSVYQSAHTMVDVILASNGVFDHLDEDAKKRVFAVFRDVKVE